MLVSLKINNCRIFDQETEFSMRADMHGKRFRSNIATQAGVNLVKSAVVLGPNNSGKTNLVTVIQQMKHVLLNRAPAVMEPNLFSDGKVCDLEVDFTAEGKEFVFSYRFDAGKREYLQEKFVAVERKGGARLKKKTILLRDCERMKFQCEDRNLKSAMRTAGRDNLLMYLLDVRQFPVLSQARETLTAFAESIDIVYSTNIPLRKTLEILKQTGETQRMLAEFIRKADLAMDRIEYNPELKINFNFQDENGAAMEPPEAALNEIRNNIDFFHIFSYYHGKPVPSIIYDSTGTKKFAALASYVIDALRNGRTLVVDELDNSLHFRLTRAIVALFNNELNDKAQLIATAHDISLLDCRKLFRKEQIWFAHKDEKHAYLYSLADFTAKESGVRGDTSDIAEAYRHGMLGALPEPEFFETLLEIHNEKTTEN